MIHLSGWDTSYTPITEGESLQKGRDDLIHFKKRRIWKNCLQLSLTMRVKAFVRIVVLFREAKANGVVTTLRVIIWASPK